MSYIVGSFAQFFPGFIRKEYTRNLIDGHGEYVPCVMHGLRVIRGRSLEIQALLTGEGGAGAAFLAPIEAFCWRVPDAPRRPGEPVDMTYVQPWDSFSETFGVHEFEFHRRMKCLVLPDRRQARYRFTLDFAESSLAYLPVQHKHLHLVELNDGSIGAFPNNRLLWVAPEWYAEPIAERPNFLALEIEAMAE